MAGGRALNMKVSGAIYNRLKDVALARGMGVTETAEFLLASALDAVDAVADRKDSSDGTD